MGVWPTRKEQSFCGPSSIPWAPPLPCQAWAGEGAWVPAALKGLNALALSSQPPLSLGPDCVFSGGPLNPSPSLLHDPPSPSFLHSFLLHPYSQS